MTNEDWEKAKEIFHEALELPETERDPFITNRCSGNAEIEAEVRRMIANDPGSDHAASDSFERLIANANPADFADLLVGREFGGYRILGKLGEGGQGTVFLAEQKDLIQPVALKVHKSGDLKALIKEGQILVGFRHPSIPRIYASFEDLSLYFLVTEYVKGRNLRSLLRGSQIQTNRAIEIALSVADALAYAHSKTIIHRDVKPENIMITDDGEVVLVDFGVAKVGSGQLAGRVLSETAPGTLVGTRPYMSPEQASGDKVDERTDVWALGVVLYEMLTGSRPFNGTPSEVFRAILKDEPTLDHDAIPAPVQEVIRKSLQKEPNDRYQSMSQLRSNLLAFFETIKPTPIDLPFPDAEHYRGAVTPLRAVLPQIGPSTSLPFDLGTVWGLDRSSFIGIVAAGEDDPIYAGLQRTERLLFDVTGDAEKPKVPVRWWLKVDPKKVPNGPGSILDILQSLPDRTDERVKYVTTHDFPATVIPGFFFEVLTGQSEEIFDVLLLNWCRQIAAGFAGLTQPAVVIQLNGNDAYQRSESLLTRLATLNVPTQMMILTPPRHASGAKAAADPFETIGREEGFYFCSWAADAIRGSKWRDGNGQNYGAVMKEIGRHRKDGTAYESATTAAQVVHDLERISAAGDSKVVPQFLQFVDQFLSERLGALMTAYARSNSRSVRRAGLLFAVQSRADWLMDAWVEGNQLEPGYVPEKSDMYADPQAGPVIEPLVLALLRLYQKGRNRARIKEFIGQQAQILSSDLGDVVKLSLGDLKAEEFIKNNSTHRLLLAMRAGVELESSTYTFPTLKLSQPDLWWMLESLPPDRSRISKILTLSAKERAVFGLTTVQEWEAISIDAQVERQVLTCRRRPIRFLFA